MMGIPFRIHSFSIGKVTNATSYTNGELDTPVVSIASVVNGGNVQPARGQHLFHLPEGSRNSEAKMLYADKGVFDSLGLTAPVTGDTVFYIGEEYQINNVKDFSTQNRLPYWECLIFKNNEEEGQ